MRIRYAPGPDREDLPHWKSAGTSGNILLRVKKKGDVLRGKIPAAILVALTAFLAFPAAAAEEPIATGPEVGSRIPDIQAPDQSGEIRSFEDLRGPEGLLLLFFRTADW